MEKPREVPPPPELKGFTAPRRHKPVPLWIPIAMLVVWLALILGWLAWALFA